MALFTKAELIEVTRDSIQEFNHDVLAGVNITSTRTLKPALGRMTRRKLVDFHGTQGNVIRWSIFSGD